MSDISGNNDTINNDTITSIPTDNIEGKIIENKINDELKQEITETSEPSITTTTPPTTTTNTTNLVEVTNEEDIILEIWSREILDSRGNPTVEVDLLTDKGIYKYILLFICNVLNLDKFFFLLRYFSFKCTIWFNKR